MDHEIIAANGTGQQTPSRIWFDGQIKLLSASLLRISFVGMITVISLRHQCL
jgi:hypothetical protein